MQSTSYGKQEFTMIGRARRSALPFVLVGSLALGLAALSPACGPDDPDDNGPDNGNDTNENVSKETIGPDGGSITAKGCWIGIPAGALSGETEITVTQLEEAPHAGFQAFSPVCAFEPVDISLAKPANVKLSFEASGELSALFHAYEDSDRFRRVGGAVDGAWIGAHVSSLGRFFVAHGFEYDDPADMDCVRARMIGGRAQPEYSSVALNFSAEDCDGRPLMGLGLSDFVVRENAADVGTQGAVTSLAGESHQALVTVVLDASSPVQVVMSSVIEALREMIDVISDEGLPVLLSIEMFGGAEESTVWLPHRLLGDELRQQVGDLVFDLPEERHDPNLHGAVTGALSRLGEARDAVEERNAGGALTSGFVVLISAQADGAGLVSLDDAVEAVEGARENGVRVLGVGVHGNDYDPFSLHALAPDGVSSARGARLSFELGSVARKIARLIESSHRAAYCSEQTQGVHTAGVEVSGPASSEPASLYFDATGFGAACDAELLSEACDDKQCGAPGCGVCDDRHSECDAETATCRSFCERPEYCGGDTFTNPRGYEQSCPEDDTNTRCGDRCVDITSNTQHCGECWEACESGFVCVDKSCVCPEGLTDCDGVCVDTDTDTENCGLCGLECAEGAECIDGECVCPGENGIVCDGVCRDVANDPLNCGDCGVECADDLLVGCAHGTCGGPMWPTTPMPNPEGAGLPNPASYEIEGDRVTDNVTDIVWYRQPSPDLLSWSDAKAFCRQLDLGDGGAWRLPSRIELVSLVDFTTSPAIDGDAFPDMTADGAWSASPRVGHPNQAWAVDFGIGDTQVIMTSAWARALCVSN